ncbi:YdcF family protein [Microbacterium marinilacus]|uniref:YdcF family protein n=1 Tax=Microbacterium marinilacus TaxID=415209 RepID=A0ABP7B2Q3_9MICO|nr:YdcF family protein [Microbacterium marinilacus]MBY0688700.1 YdcF family protein [Microbacterium marinilacus]
MPGFLTIVFLLLGVALARHDPRRLLPGVLLTLGAASLVASLVGLVLELGAALARLDDDARNLVGGLMLLLVPLVSGLALGGALVANGVTMLRRERVSPAHALSLLAGIAVLGVLALAVVAFVASWLHLAVALLLLIAPIGYVGTAFVAFLGWSRVYALLARRAPSPSAVIVLGAGLANGKVTPLLAQRVALGVETQRAHPASVLVLSGGQGADEPRSEADAMAEYAREIGAPGDRILIERQSTNTEENLTLSQTLLAERDVRGPVLAVTSDYHAFRAANLLRRLGIAGQAIGARTARYYVPSALLREFAALLRDHLLLNAVALGALMLPVVAFVVVSLLGMVSTS